MVNVYQALTSYKNIRPILVENTTYLLRPFSGLRQFCVDSIKWTEKLTNRVYTSLLQYITDPATLGMEKNSDDYFIRVNAQFDQNWSIRDYRWYRIWRKLLKNMNPDYLQVPHNPNLENPKNILECLFGYNYLPDRVEPLFFLDGVDGYTSFYIPSYFNMTFIPDFIAKFYYLYFAEYAGEQLLDNFFKAMFVLLTFYQQGYGIKVIVSWFLSFNPFVNLPTQVFWQAYDWIEETIGQFTPTAFGVPWCYPVVWGSIGKIKQLCTHIVITYPYLASEQERVNVAPKHTGYFEEQVHFKGIPIMWKQYWVPNHVKELWYNHMPEVIEYYQKSNPELDPSHFLPDGHDNRLMELLSDLFSRVFS